MSRRTQPSARVLRIRGTLLRGVGVLERRPVFLGLFVAGVGGLIAIVAALSVNGVPFQNRYEFSVNVPGDTPPLKVGDQARVAGKFAGLITEVDPARDSVEVKVKLYPQYAPIGRDAHVHVGVVIGTSLAYLILTPGDTRENALPEGGTIPANQVTLSSSLPQALEAFDKRTRDAIAHDFDVLGRASVGQGRRANEGIVDLKAVAEDGTPLFDAATPQAGVLAGLLANASRAVHGLRGNRDDDFAANIDAAARALEPFALRAQTFGENFDLFAQVETEALRALPPTTRAFDQAALALRDVDPAARAISDFLGDAARLFSAGPTLERETARFRSAARPLLDRIAPVARLLIRPAKQLDVAAAPLKAVATLFDRYGDDLDRLGAGLVAAFSYRRNGVPTLRASGSLGCHTNRNPYPEPGQSFTDRKPGC